MFLLVRKTCSIYKDFAQYCHAQNPTDSESSSDSTPESGSKKFLPSPEFEAVKMLSPFDTIKRMSPMLKSQASARSVLRNISAKKKVPDGFIGKLPSTPSGKEFPMRNEIRFPEVMATGMSPKLTKPLPPSTLASTHV